MIRLAYLILFYFIACAYSTRAEDIPSTCIQALKHTLNNTHMPQKIPKNCKIVGDFLAWYQYQETTKHNDFDKIMFFIHTHPSWPKIKVLQQRAEESIASTTSSSTIIRWFMQYTPITSVGNIHYAHALLQSGKEVEAVIQIKHAWRKQQMTQKQQKFFYQKYKKYLNTKDLMHRLETLGWSSNSKGIYGLKSYLSAEIQNLALALIGLIQRESNIDILIKKVPSRYQHHPLLLFHRIKWRLRHKKYDSALALMHKAITEKADTANPAAWLQIRRTLYRYLLKKKQYKEAYHIIQHHVEKDPKAVDLEWCSGWIALRFLDDPERANTHFQNVYYIATTPISQAKGCYWVAQAQKKMGNIQAYKDWLKRASNFYITFYGQLAQQELYGKISITLKEGISAKNLNHLWDEYINLFSVLKKWELSRHIKPFLLHMAHASKSPQDQEFAVKMAAQYAPEFIVLTTKVAGRKGMIPLDITFPTLTLHQIPKKIPVDLAVIHAVIRQESGFDQYGTSPAGAQGLMQLMPEVAKNVAQRWKIPFTKGCLHNASHMNVQIGSTHMADLLKTFEGDIILSLASYNAGLSNVKKWIKHYGDPRKNVHILDWIETIPFKETRSYIYRVLESVSIYESMLNTKSPHGVSSLRMPSLEKTT